MNDPRSCCTRREALRFAFGGAGSLLAAGLLHELCAAEERQASVDPLAPRAPHFPAKAKRVIFMFHTGGVSHVDTFDPKPKLILDHGKTVTIDDVVMGKPGKYNRYLKKAQWAFKPYGKSGVEVSDLFPHVGGRVDDICVIRSLQSDHTNHYEATLMMHTGSITFARPSIGAWVSYGLGTVNRNLPSFLVLAPAVPYAGDQAWGADFLPGCHQGTRVTPGPTPIADLARRSASPALQDLERDLLQQCNQDYLDRRPGDAELAARVRSFETAYGMQQEAPEAFDLSKETDATLQLYGLQRGANTGFAWQCLVARRLSERGVRFIELIDCGSSNNWDSHADMTAHEPLAKNVDQAIAGLLTDLKQRGMFEDTLVVWCTEFGRTPYHQQPDAKGREHHHWAFSGWLAGAGVKGGLVHGATDDYGIHVAENPVHVHDFHATILHLMGLDHEKLTFRHAGRDFRLTDVSGRVVKEILA